MYESSPATNGIRAEPASHADPIPAIDTLSKNANGATIHAASNSRRHVAHRLHDALQHADVLFAHRYKKRQRRADIQQPRQARRPMPPRRAKYFCGFSISSPITDASSSPTKPKQITPNEFSTNRGFAGM